MARIERIGILTSGGDCAGLNPVIRAVVSRATGLGWTVVGIRNGTSGLLAVILALLPLITGLVVKYSQDKGLSR